MKKYLYTLLALFYTAFAFRADAETALPGQWRIHNTFDSNFQETIDTPERVYLLALAQTVNADKQAWNQRHGQLFTLDKETCEIQGYNAANYLTGNEIIDIAYNPLRRYLLIIYDNYSIDLLYDDDSVRTIHGLASSTLNSSKTVNGVTFDSRAGRAYLATDFGYIVVDDSKYVIPESRIYNRKVNSIGRVGDWLVLGSDEGLFISPLSDRHTDFSSFTKVDGVTGAVSNVMPLTDNTFGLKGAAGLMTAAISGQGQVSLEPKDSYKYTDVIDNRDGYLLLRWGAAVQLNRDGSLATLYTDKVNEPQSKYGSWDFRTFYYPVSRRGIGKSVSDGGYKWDFAALYPVNAPQPTGVFSFDYSEATGMLAGNETHNRIYSFADYMNYPGLVSGYERGTWTPYGAGVSTDPKAQYMKATYGPVIDPVAPEYMWLGSRDAGLFRVDTRDNSIEMYSHPAHAAKGTQGFHAVFPTSPSWTDRCLVSAISFDGDGNLWCVFNPSHADPGEGPLYCWKAADRRAGNVSAFKEVPVKGYGSHYENFRMVATKSPSSRGFVAFAPASMYYQPLYLFYHAGSIDDTSDDRLSSYTTFQDQDGTAVSYTFINTLYEDPATGYIWVGTDAGVFYFNPNDAIRSSNGNTLQVRRPKVARNDGTNLADYLLSGSDVMGIAADGAGRKWFATNGGGILVSSADGSRVIDQFTASNSLLPTDLVFSIAFDPDGNAVWIGGAKQTATYFCDATPAAEDYSEVLAFPNPVRPEYSGPVTIKGLMDDSLVKIVDASGSLVRELGISNGGMALWDLTDMSGREVSAGVYYVMSSTSTESQPSAGNSTKILVIR